ALRFFAAVFLTDFLSGFLAGFAGAFLAAFLTAFLFVFLTAFFTVFVVIFLTFPVARLLLRLRFLATEALKARFFFVPRFFDVLFLEVFLAGVATTISFIVQMDLPGNEPGGRDLLHGFRKQAKYRENQGFSFQIVGFGIARGAVDLFPYLCKPCKAGQVRIGVVVGPQPLTDPAIDTVDERRQRAAVAA